MSQTKRLKDGMDNHFTLQVLDEFTHHILATPLFDSLTSSTTLYIVESLFSTPTEAEF
jgi:hypothetical protein